MSFYYPIDLSDGAIFEPSGEKEAQIMVDLLNIQPRQRAADLGSGDGRLVIALAKKGMMAFGLEKNPELVHLSQKNIQKELLSHAAFIYNVNFWDHDLSSFKIITVFQYYTIMERLEKKLMKELQKGSQIVSHHWTFPNWQPEKQVDDIYLYLKK